MYLFVYSNRRATNWQQFCCRQQATCWTCMLPDVNFSDRDERCEQLVKNYYKNYYKTAFNQKSKPQPLDPKFDARRHVDCAIMLHDVQRTHISNSILPSDWRPTSKLQASGGAACLVHLSLFAFVQTELQCKCDSSTWAPMNWIDAGLRLLYEVFDAARGRRTQIAFMKLLWFIVIALLLCAIRRRRNKGMQQRLQILWY